MPPKKTAAKPNDLGIGKPGQIIVDGAWADPITATKPDTSERARQITMGQKETNNG